MENRMPILIAALAAAALAQAEAPEPLDWRALEAPILSQQVQLTSPDLFLKAGEAYFSPSGGNIIFQATPVPAAGAGASPHYAMFVATIDNPFHAVRRGEDKTPRLSNIIQISQPGSANTCGWFHPKDEGRVLFGSTVLPPRAPDRAGYQRETGRYRWQFPAETEIVSGRVNLNAGAGAPLSDPSGRTGIHMWLAPIMRPLFIEPGYSAEGSWSPDGKYIIYTWVNPETNDPDIYIRDPETGYVSPIITAKGYDGGPFFSPDGHWITYRSDRAGNNLLQLFIAELGYDDLGRPSGIKREIQLTDNEYVNWAPFWHPSGAFLIYATNEAAPETHNYEVFAIDARGLSDEPERMRLTFAEGFDGLPVFNALGNVMMWTSQRGGAAGAGERAESQVWMARFDLSAFVDKFSAPGAGAEGE
jgi:hypothetical protein